MAVLAHHEFTRERRLPLDLDQNGVARADRGLASGTGQWQVARPGKAFVVRAGEQRDGDDDEQARDGRFPRDPREQSAQLGEADRHGGQEQPDEQAEGQAQGEGLAAGRRFQARRNHDLVARGSRNALELEMNFGLLQPIEEKTMLPFSIFFHAGKLLDTGVDLG